MRVSLDRPLAFTAQGPFDWEYNLVRFLEREGYDLSYQTNIETDVRPESLLEHRLVIVAGHECWTKHARRLRHCRALGTNLAFANSNAAYWQIRYGGRTIVGYKEAAPDPEPNAALRTVRSPPRSPRPECGLQGVMFYRIREHQTGPVDYTATDAATSGPWFAGTGFTPGDKVLDIVGNEWDSRPEAPVPPQCVKPGLVTLFHYGDSPQRGRSSVPPNPERGSSPAARSSFPGRSILSTRVASDGRFRPTLACSSSCGTRSPISLALRPRRRST